MTSRFAIVTLLVTLACSSSSPSGNNPPPGGPTPTAVAINDNTYGPANMSVPVGTTVRWQNGGTVAHTSSSNTGVWNSGVLGASYTSGGYLYEGASYSYTFNTPGTYPYSCTYHAGVGMQGTITVTP